MDDAVRQLIHDLHHPSAGEPYQYVVAVTGGGAQAAALLLGVPGASKALLEVLVPYHPRSLSDFLGREPEQSCSTATALLLSRRAFGRARELAPDRTCAGIGCTAALATDRPKKGDHRFHLGITTENGDTVWSLTLAKGLRDREGEEAVLDAVMLNAMAMTFGSIQRIDERRRADETLQIENHPVDPLLASLYRGERPAVCRTVEDRWTTDVEPPALLLAGSFNPLHDGHLGMGLAAANRAGKPLAFEIAVDNVDKPPLIVEEVCRRTRQFAGRYPVWVTRAPTFVRKTPLFPGATFVIGHDTAERLVQAKYYDDCEEQMRRALASFVDHGCRFLVAGRADPASGRFLTLDDVAIPEEVRVLFEAIPESDFRVDLSSTQVRKMG